MMINGQDPGEMSLSTEDLINLAFSGAKSDEFDPTMLTTVRAPAIHNYEGKENVEAMLRQILLRILIDMPADPVKYMTELIIDYRPKKVIICGPPACGKRTLCEGIAHRLGLEHISVSDLVDGMMMTDTELGAKMREIYDDGLQMPEELVEKLVIERLREKDCMSKGWIMDGWPRTGEHARNMRALGLDPQIMVKFEVPDSVIEDRVSFRVLDPETGTLYHNISDPPPLGIGVRCITRPGESSDEIIDRISEYKENVGSVLSVLEQSSDFRAVPIDANISFQQLQDDLTVMIAREIAV